MARRHVTWENDFPNELWLAEVFRHIDPTDVLSLSQTCNTLRSRLSQKSVWVHILFLVCQKNGLFLGSYPIDYMDVAEIRQLCLSPQMWDAVLRNSAVTLRGRLDLIPSLPTVTLGSPDWPQLDKGYLVPGGRFFVVLKDCYVAAFLELWDLGVPRRKTVPRPTVLASKSISIRRGGPDHDWLLTVNFLPGSDTLEVAIAEIGEDTRITILSVSPSEKAPKFEERGALRIMGISGPCQMYLHRSFLLFRGSKCPLLLWDYSQNRIVKLEPITTGGSIDEYIMTNEHILHFGTHHISSWDLAYIPHFTQGLLSGAFHINSLETHEPLPDWTAQYPIQPSNETDRFLVPVQCTNRTRLSMTFDILLFLPRTCSSTIHRFTLKTIFENDAASFRLEPVAFRSFPPQFFPSIRPFDDNKRPAGDDVPFSCISGLFGDPVQAQTMGTFASGEYSPSDPWLVEARRFRLPPGPPSLLRTLVYGLGRPSGEARQASDVGHNSPGGEIVVTLLEPSKPLAACPATGRFIYRVKNSAQDLGAAYLVDYL